MSFLYFLESIRNPVFDFLFSIITLLGEETVFMAVGMIVFWCFDKYQGYFLLTTGFWGTVTNQFLKIVCKVPRPWVTDPGFSIVESAREAATGYSFPSGHTQSAVGLFGGIARWNKNTVLRILCLAACVLVPLSRMYLGVHTPMDVLFAILTALIIIFVAYPLYVKATSTTKYMYGLLGTLTVVTLCYLLFVTLFPFSADTDVNNLLSAQKNGYTLVGCMVGLLLTYFIDEHFIKFPTRAAWWTQIIKVLGGLAAVLIVKELFRWPLDAIFGGHLIARAIRYFLMVVVGGILWPMTFEKLLKFEKKIKEKIQEKSNKEK